MNQTHAGTEQCPKCGSLLDVRNFDFLSEAVCPKCGDLIKVLRKFEYFVLLTDLGNGPRGRVYRAYDETIERDVALKLLNRESYDHPEYLAALESRASILSGLAFPNVLKVLSFGALAGRNYLVSDYADGGSLAGKLHNQIRLSEYDTLGVGIQAAAALQNAQRYGLLHGNLNPANILYVENRLVVGDFGQTIPVDQARRNSSALLAAEEYLAPERMALQDEDFRSDIYSLGATLYRCLTGRVVRAPQAAIRAGRESEFIAVGPTFRGVSKPTVQVIQKMLANRPADRFQSYDDLVDALQEAQQSQTSVSEPPPMPKIEAKEEAVVARPKFPVPTIAIGMALFVVGLFVAFGIKGRSPKSNIKPAAAPAPAIAEQREAVVSTPEAPSADSGPLLHGSVQPSSALPYDLTHLGTLDWAHWNGVTIRKATGNHMISDLTPIGKGAYGIWNTATLAVSWTDGYPIPAKEADHGHVWCQYRAEAGWSFSATAGTALHTLTVLYGGAEKAKVKITAELSDHSAPEFSDIQAINDTTFRLATFVYRAKSASQRLTITVTKVMDSGAPSADLSAAWLQ